MHSLNKDIMMSERRLSSLEDIARHIEEKHSFILLPHIGIDGDDLGSMIALSMGLAKLGKVAHIISHDPVPPLFSFLPSIEKVSSTLPEGTFDSALLMECTNASRLPRSIDLRAHVATVVNIDHHPGNRIEGDLNYIDCSAAAVGEIVYDLLMLLSVPLDMAMAMGLYVAILTDTGGFQFANTTAKTHRIVADLLRFPLKVDEISRHIFREVSLDVLRLEGDVMARLRSSMGGKIVWSTVTLDSLRLYGVEDEETQFFVEELNVVKGSLVVVLFKEIDEGAVRVSMRSTTPLVPVNEVASRYGGGGHVLAAGCTVEGSLESVQDEVLGALAAFMEARGC
ncbi:MAG: bifunctional oligoribonuclease/PAP phosphatase NrnA [Candidatus Eremiobacteraeota bacterium]|nr:bifunctional oligoribonuclease/PAP phosphatase NrnA [Candidatus Eremiobacteraeota bacterium]